MNVIAKVTPMIQQYLEIKSQHQDSILFYRMGDFYEMFFDDALIASKILGITLTSRNKKDDAVQVPMCGIPYHAAQSYIAKIIKTGRRVAICEQTENPAEAKGIVKREVVRVVSPGVITEDHLLDDKSNNYVASLVGKEANNSLQFGIGFLDVSTGEFLIGEYLDGGDNTAAVLDQLSRLTPSELLIFSPQLVFLKPLLQQIDYILPAICITERPQHVPSSEHATIQLLDHFGVLTLDGFGCGHFTTGLSAAVTLLEYTKETQKCAIDHIGRIVPLNSSLILHIDESSRRNLELTQSLVGGQRDGSLLSVIDNTCTPMGARLLKHHLLFPLQDKAQIIHRLDAVTFFFKNSAFRKNLRNHLDNVYDLERLNSRMILGLGNGRDMLAMKQSFASLPQVFHLLGQCDTLRLIDIRQQIDVLTDLHDLLEASIDSDVPVTLREGHLIKKGFNKELDTLVELLLDHKKLVLDLETKEREATGIAKLKICYNKVFGYFIEVSKTHENKVPLHYTRKQTLVNAERFITPELKDFEDKILGAHDRRIELEYNLFIEIRSQLANSSQRIQKTASLLAELDFFASGAECAFKHNYRRPDIHDGDHIQIIEGRHPVIERVLPSGKFVPNDVYLDQNTEEMLIITGPNMAGKSTVLRQTALIVLMAQMGLYVPAETASIGIVDRIFTRVGAMDNLRRGQSTFMVEMSETANILNNATNKSLVILDEIGRGTSTFDGLSIAWAVAEELVEKNKKGVKTLFATHYHELTELVKTHKRVRNYSIAVREWQGSIIFLHKLIKGGSSRSYGIQVAALAGVPNNVVTRAKQLLSEIELGKFMQITDPNDIQKKKGSDRKSAEQLPLFPPPSDPIREHLKRINLNECTPLTALTELFNLKNML